MMIDMFGFRKKDKDISRKEAQEIIKVELSEMVENYSLSDWMKLFANCEKFYSENTRNDYKFRNSFKELFSILSKSNPKLYIKVLEKYLNLNDPFNVYIDTNELINILGKDEGFKLLNKYSYKTKASWLFSFYESLADGLVEKKDIKEIINLYKTAEVTFIPYGMDYLKKYLQFKPNILIQVTQILINRTNKEKLPFINNLEILFNSHSENPENLVFYYKDNLEILKELYLQSINHNQYFDYEAEGLNAIINIDNSFLEKYIKALFKKKKYLSSHDISNNFSILWLREDSEDLFFGIIEILFKITKDKIMREGEILAGFFTYEEGKDQSNTKIDLLTKKYIDCYYNDKERITFLFEFIAELPYKKREEFISFFLEKNTSFEFFKKLSFEPMIKSWYGSRVPYLQKEKDHYNSLLKYLSGVKFLQHKQLIENKIKYIDKEIKMEKKSDFMDDY